MLGSIGKFDVLAHPAVTIRCFGWRVFVRTLVARRGETFLSLLMRESSFEPPSHSVFEIVRRCVELEKAAGRIYASLAGEFHQEPVRLFFETLARQEHEHAELLDLCRIAAMRGGWDGSCIDPWRESVPYLERRMREAEAKRRAVKNPADAFWLTIEIESSEVNQLFEAVVAATDSEFVRKFLRFRSTAREHLDYIRQTIPEFEPSLKPACERMLSFGARDAIRRGHEGTGPQVEAAAAEKPV